MSELVYIDEYGLDGSNFYFRNYENKGISKEDITAAGLTNDRVQVAPEIIEPLRRVDEALRRDGYKLYIKEGYRSKAVYEIVYQRRCEKFGKEITDTLLNMRDQPHTTGRTVDVCLFDLTTGTEVYVRDSADGTDALFVDFYKNKPGAATQKFQQLQAYLIRIMQENGFRLGLKREYFHFDYKPETPPNY